MINKLPNTSCSFQKFEDFNVFKASENVFKNNTRVFTTAFVLMISLAVNLIVRNGKNGVYRHPPAADVSGIPNLFGVSVYSFMCQHSIPSLVTPIKDKSKLKLLLLSDYVLIFIFYVLLGMTAVFAFDTNSLEDIYTLNFQVCLPTSL